MSQYVMFADLGEKVVITDAPEHPEPRPIPGAVAQPWNACTIPGCTHGPCPAKLRAWASYGRRYMCEDAELRPPRLPAPAAGRGGPPALRRALQGTSPAAARRGHGRRPAGRADGRGQGRGGGVEPLACR